ncbi:DUF2071 domain-containing protein [Microbacterium sp. IEGM 1404]|uniref:DUF2071 domain-containing protein n=1 Tax=Microbacterium sp. IEGM 1404 TaxID=3047084 RepID=UPI0024B73AFC|nr:DUF2071 domain-containing protein [Microbacterium sp. IEGM 1404]MDI9891930.1 DUF2071 domain-containing protein [Microbacterium sp. IEGM 1404]
MSTTAHPRIEQPRPMPTPPMVATIERRLLVNYRLDPDVARSMLPDGMRPQIVDDSAVAGVCLIRLRHLRPAILGRAEVGHTSENAAHRIAAEWDTPDGPRTGVYIPRRHSSSRLVRLVGGRIFPGTHAAARVHSATSDHRIEVKFDAVDLHVRVRVDPEPYADFDSGLFDSLTTASEFFRKDAEGWSPRRSGGLEGLRLDTDSWSVTHAGSPEVESSFFDALPAGAAVLDHVLLMRGVPARWTAAGGTARAA